MTDKNKETKNVADKIKFTVVACNDDVQDVNDLFYINKLRNLAERIEIIVKVAKAKGEL